MSIKEVFACIALFVVIVLYIILVFHTKESAEHKKDLLIAKLAVLTWAIIIAGYLKVYVIDLLFVVLFLYEILRYHKSKKKGD